MILIHNKVRATEADADGETTKRVEKLNRMLQAVDKKKFFEVIAAPDSYSQTVENLFLLSFLVR